MPLLKSKRESEKTKFRTLRAVKVVRGGDYGAWGGYGYNTSTHVDQYTEGTVNVDMVDISANQMVWEGVAVGRLKEDRSNEELTENINAAVASMFAEYPFRAAGK